MLTFSKLECDCEMEGYFIYSIIIVIVIVRERKADDTFHQTMSIGGHCSSQKR